MRLLIIGGCGYVGSALARYLPEYGHHVTTLDRQGRPDYLRDYRRFDRGFDDYDGIIWAAGHSSVKACLDDPIGAFHNNVTGIVDLVSQLKGQRFLYMSSSALYGVSNEAVNKDMFAFSKLTAERAIRNLYRNYSICRLGSVAGPGAGIRLDTLFNRMVFDAVRLHKITLYNGQYNRPILGIIDLCRWVERVLYLDGMYSCDLCSFNTAIGSLAVKVAHRFRAEIEEIKGHPGYDFYMGCTFHDAQDTPDRLMDQLGNHFGELK